MRGLGTVARRAVSGRTVTRAQLLDQQGVLAGDNLPGIQVSGFAVVDLGKLITAHRELVPLLRVDISLAGRLIAQTGGLITFSRR